MELLNEGVGSLLRCGEADFWTRVARDPTVAPFLDSFLRHRARSHDGDGAGAEIRDTEASL